MTLGEITTAIEYGVDVVKIFPGDILTVSFIKDVKGPMPQVNMMPSGGVDVGNAGSWIKAGCFALGAGSSLIGGAKTGDYDRITQTAIEFRREILKARG
jgi:2-dehydro-3-deoxyphosphogluconate aldolase/(4S)-4-hydroxy-2-oxoglutarate aldolase